MKSYCCEKGTQNIMTALRDQSHPFRWLRNHTWTTVVKRSCRSKEVLSVRQKAKREDFAKKLKIKKRDSPQRTSCLSITCLLPWILVVGDNKRSKKYYFESIVVRLGRLNRMYRIILNGLIQTFRLRYEPPIRLWYTANISVNAFKFQLKGLKY